MKHTINLTVVEDFDEDEIFETIRTCLSNMGVKTYTVDLDSGREPILKTIEDIRNWVQSHPEYPAAALWEYMLWDMDHGGDEYTFEDFQDEAMRTSLSPYEMEKMFG